MRMVLQCCRPLLFDHQVLNFRADIDGLCVVLVVAAHAGVPCCAGGFVGEAPHRAGSFSALLAVPRAEYLHRGMNGNGEGGHVVVTEVRW